MGPTLGLVVQGEGPGLWLSWGPRQAGTSVQTINHQTPWVGEQRREGKDKVLVKNAGLCEVLSPPFSCHLLPLGDHAHWPCCSSLQRPCPGFLVWNTLPYKATWSDPSPLLGLCSKSPISEAFSDHPNAPQQLNRSICFPKHLSPTP